MFITTLAVLAGAVVAVSLSLAQTSHHSKRHAIYWGAALGNPAPYNWGPIRSFERMVGKQLSLVSFGAPFANCSSGRCHFYTFPWKEMRVVRSHGAVPLLNWASIPSGGSAAPFSDRAVASGRYDGPIRAFARSAKAYRKPFFLRFDWEMNGNWWAWGTTGHGAEDSPAAFVAMWRHVHNIFHRAHVRNVTWVWCPNVDYLHEWTSLRRLYPGNAYVNWTCLDGYNWGSTGPGSPGARRGGWVGFDRLFSLSYRTIARHIAPSKPMLIGEVGSSYHGGSQGAWIDHMLKALPSRYPKVHGLVYYDVADGWGFEIRRGSSGAKGFANGLKSPAYAGNRFCRLARNPIQLPALPLRGRSCARS
jgi:hypothetical protein